MVITKTLTVPLYDNTDICIVITDDTKEMAKKTKINYPFESLLGAVCEAPGRKGRCTIYLCLNIEDPDFKDSVIVHEALHVTNRIMGRISAQPDFYNDEPQAYLIEWVYDETMKVIKKYKDECNKETTGS